MDTDYSKLGKLIQSCIEDSAIRDNSPIMDVVSWTQGWGNTACGFGIGGQTLTSAQMVLVVRIQGFYVYHAGRFAYEISKPNEAFHKAYSAHRFLGKNEYHGQYES